LIAITACLSPQTTTQQVASGEKGAPTEKPMRQGIRGKVVWVEGNQMPGPDRPRASGGKPVEREMLVYEPVSIQQLEMGGTVFKQVPGKAVASVRTNAQGEFEVELLPGKYSLFSKEESGFFANGFDGEGIIAPIEVKAGVFTEVLFRIDYQAAY
jgi:hypothetical protein